MRRGWSLQQPPQQHFVDAAAETFFAVDDHNGDAGGVSLTQLRIGVDIDKLRLQAVAFQQFAGIVAQVAARAGVNRDLMFGHGIGTDGEESLLSQFYTAGQL